MKSYFFVVLLVSLLLVAGCQKSTVEVQPESAPKDTSPLQGAATADAQDSSAEKKVTVLSDGDISVLGNEGFSQNEVTISLGDSLTWKNEWNKNVVLTFQKGTSRSFFNSPAIKPGETYSNTFYETGEYNYWGVGNGVKGKVIVQE